MNDQVRPDQTLIHSRAREAFGWIEYGYISASMYLLNNTDDGIGVAGDMQIDFRMQPRQMKAFLKGWQIRMDEQTGREHPQ